MDDDNLSRRQMLGGVGVGLAVAAIGEPAAAQPPAAQPPAPPHAPAAPGAAPPAPLTVKHDPQGLYPRPPFPRQTQPWPGLASKMQPRPDHGETTYRGSGRLVGRKALVTGGDSGIGRAAAIAFAREGADVAINYLLVEEPDAREVIALIRGAGRKAVAIPGDILAEDAFDATMKTNVYAPYWITKAALPHLPPGSSIIITASVQALQPSPNLFDYAQTKAANVAFARSLAKQLAPRGIRVNAVAPGPFWTPLQVSGGQPPDRIPDFGKHTPLGRPGQPVELAPIYVTLASAESSYSSGQVFGASGGTGVD